MGGLVAVGHTGCDGGDSGPTSSACSSCQEAYTLDDCKAWGDKAGCEGAALAEEGTCDPGFAGCTFTNCAGVPICDDLGEADCASCDGDLSQADCDSLAEAAGCSGATTGMFNACGNDVTGCNFEGCDFRPECP